MNTTNKIDYYPFGMLMPGRSQYTNEYRYGYQNQEMDNEIYGLDGSAYAYKYRMDDPRVGRFWSIDPLASKYPWNSPYAFSENRVIDGVELEGLEVNLLNKADGELYKAMSHIKVTNTIWVGSHASEQNLTDRRHSPKREEQIPIKTPTEFDKIMNTESEVWRNRENSKDPIVVVLVSCHGYKKALEFSKAKGNENVIFIASEEQVYGNSDGTFGTYPNEAAANNKDVSKPGVWHIIKGGESYAANNGLTYIEGNITPERMATGQKLGKEILKIKTKIAEKTQSHDKNPK